MIHWRSGVVDRVRAQWPGAVEYTVTLDEPSGPQAETPVVRQSGATAPGAGSRDAEQASSARAGREVRALAYTDLVGRPEPGDTVLLNVTALERGLGTGGMALVIAVPERLPQAAPGAARAPGHLVKARYTPLQAMVLGVDEQESPHHEVLREADTLAGLPVVVADLHSAVPAILAALRADRPGVNAVYVMTDGGALPIAYSRTVAGLREAGWLSASVTVGQAFGGDAEAVNLHTGLLAAAQVLQADVAVVAQGPGNLGTGTRWGFSGVAAGEAINAIATLGGRAVASLRVSQADGRERHRGVSHHSLTAYGRVALLPADLPVPLLPADLGAQVMAQARELSESSKGRLTLRSIDLSGLSEALARCPVPLSTMGRGMKQDAASFLAAAAAGRHAATLLPS